MAYTFYQAMRAKEPLWPKVEAYYSRTWNAFQMEMHAHESRCEVMYVFSGDCTVEYEDAAGTQSTRMRAGDFVFLDVGMKHRLLTPPNEPCTMLNVEFSFAPMPYGMHTLRGLAEGSEDLRAFAERQQPVLFGSDLRGGLFRAMDALVLGLLPKRRPEEEALRRAEMALFLLRLAQAAALCEDKVAAVGYVRRAVLYLNHHYNEPLTLKAIAARVKISPDYLSRVFRENMGESVLSFLTRARCDRAATLLERSGTALEDIAAEVGYGSRQQLTRCFRRQFGVSPSEYRRGKRPRAQKP